MGTQQEFTPEELATEEWKSLPGDWNIPYQVSTLGRVFSPEVTRTYRTGKDYCYITRTYPDKILVPTLRKSNKTNNYYVHSLSLRTSDGGSRRVTVEAHKLVASTFLPQPNLDQVVVFADGNKNNYRLSNLKISTYKELRKLSKDLGTWKGCPTDIFLKAQKKAVEVQKTPMHAINVTDGSVVHFNSRAELVKSGLLSNTQLSRVLYSGESHNSYTYHYTNGPSKFYGRKKEKLRPLREIYNFFIGGMKSKYSTKGKEENQAAIIERLKIEGYANSSFLSMPHDGRELKAMKNNGLIHLPTSVGVEYDKYRFNALFLTFKKLFPGMSMKYGDINSLVHTIQNDFDVAHLDYNGVLKTQEYLALEKLVNGNTLTFITTLDLDYHLDRYKLASLPSAVPIEEVYNNFHVVYENAYEGIKKVPMITLGVIK